MLQLVSVFDYRKISLDFGPGMVDTGDGTANRLIHPRLAARPCQRLRPGRGLRITKRRDVPAVASRGARQPEPTPAYQSARAGLQPCEANGPHTRYEGGTRGGAPTTRNDKRNDKQMDSQEGYGSASLRCGCEDSIEAMKAVWPLRVYPIRVYP